MSCQAGDSQLTNPFLAQNNSTFPSLCSLLFLINQVGYAIYKQHNVKEKIFSALFF
jgi:hypothetical protein